MTVGDTEPQGNDPTGTEVVRSNSEVVARNFGVMMVAQIITWVLSLVGAVVIPRYLGPTVVGRYHVSNSLWLIAGVVASFGMNLLIPKEIARRNPDTGGMLATTIAVRLTLFVPTSLVVVGYALLADYETQTLEIIAVIGVSAAVFLVAQALSAILQGMEQMEAMSAASIIERLIMVGGAIALLVAGFGVFAVAATVVVGAAVSVVVQARAVRSLRTRRGDSSALRTDTEAMRRMLVAAAPYFGVGFFSVLYREVDAVVISLVVENDAVLGWYSVYDRFAGTLLFVPTIFNLAVYPTLSRLFADEPDGHVRLIRYSYRLLLLVAVPLGFGLATLAEPMVVTLFGEEFANAGPVMTVGGVSIILTFLNTVIAVFLISMDHQRSLHRIIAVGALLTIPLDLALVPFFQHHFDNGAIGGSVAYLITESIVLGGQLRLLPRHTLPASSAWYAARVVLAGGVMVAAVLPLRDSFLAIPIIVGAIVYGIGVLAFRLVGGEERALVQRAIQSRRGTPA